MVHIDENRFLIPAPSLLLDDERYAKNMECKRICEPNLRTLK